MKRIISGVIALTLLVSLGLAGASCVPIVQAKTGTIEVRVTDAPGNVTAIEVTVSEVKVHKEVAGEGEWTPLTITGPNPFDLIKIRDQTQTLATEDIDTARYTQIRMTVEMVEVTYLEDGVPTTVEATIPSGELKFVRPFDVVAGGTTTLIIDFDADKSVVFTGADKVIFKPVVKLSVEHGDGEEEELLGTIAGTVTDSSTGLAIEGATVTDGTRSAITGVNGDYTIADVPVGTYTVTASAEGYESASQENVGVSDDATSTVNFTLKPIPTTGTIAGTVTDSSTGLAIEGATVTDGTRSAITGDNGDYTIADVPEATYTVTASAAGYDDDSQSVTVIAGETSTADFALNPIPTTGTIAGKVTDSSTGLAIEGATVTDGTRSAITGDNGDYTIDDVPVGTYTVTASAEGYESASQENVEVSDDATSTVNFTLEPSA